MKKAKISFNLVLAKMSLPKFKLWHEKKFKDKDDLSAEERHKLIVKEAAEIEKAKKK